MRVAVVGLVVVALASVAQAGDVDALRAAIAERRFHDAYRVAGAAIDEAPRDPEVRYLAARACAETWRFDEAEARLAEGLAIQADHAGMLGLYAWTRFLRGDDDTARPFAEKTLELDPANPDARATMARFAILDRAAARARGEPAGLAPGSAAAFVDGALAAGDLLDRATLSNGWVVEPVETGDGRIAVAVRLPSDRAIGEAAAASGAFAAVVDAAPPDERAALVARIAAARDPELATYTVALERRGRSFRIVEAAEGSGAPITDAAPRSAERDDTPSNALVIGSAIVGTIVLGALFALALVGVRRRRLSARRGPGRGSRRS